MGAAAEGGENIFRGRRRPHAMRQMVERFDAKRQKFVSLTVTENVGLSPEGHRLSTEGDRAGSLESSGKSARAGGLKKLVPKKRENPVSTGFLKKGI
ncbi:MAG: hypothetical protein LC800_19365 [Acidobacteria bacterium]|nr:hypothetical protein [Acidobacteriota bacterium]